MASNIESDGETVTVTTGDRHRIGFAMSELNVASISGRITTDWADGVPPSNPELTVLAAKAEAEAYAAHHHPSKPDEARARQHAEKSIGGTLKDMLGLP